MATQRDRLVGGLIFDIVLALQLLLGTAGFGRNALFYSLVFLHALAALAGFGSIGFAGTYAAGAYLPDDRPQGPGQDLAGSGPDLAGSGQDLAGSGQDLAGSGPAHPGGTLVQPLGGAAQPLSGPLQPRSGPPGPGDGTGDVPAQPDPDDQSLADVVPAVPDYETALRQYHAALRDFEASDSEDAAPETVAEAAIGPAGVATGPAEAAAGQIEEVPSAVEEDVVAEVIVETAPAMTSGPVDQDSEAEEMRRYFAHPARLWGCLILVPFLGAGALAAQPNGKGFDQPWVFGALAVWLAATLIAGSLVVPSLHQMRAVLLKSDDAGASPAARSAVAVRFARAGRIASRSAAVCDVLFVVALGLMIFRP
jgi:hypothetical protein